MEFKVIKENIKNLMDRNYENFIKGIISIEMGIEDLDLLDNIYAKYMDNDFNLINDKFEELKNDLEKDSKDMISSDKEKEIRKKIREHEEVVDKKSAGTLAKQKSSAIEAKVLPLSEIELTSEKRVSTGMKELDRVLGGGIVKGSMVLVGGDPGIGKSTLLLQVCKNLSDERIKVLYISGEESLQQIKIRAERIGTFGDSLKLLCETNLDTILTP